MRAWFYACLVSVSTAYAAHGIGLGQPAQLPANFQAFAYTNSAAPKGGTFTLPVQGSFDTLNPFTLKGDKEAGVDMLTLDTLMTKGQDEPFAMYGLLAEDVSLATDGLSVTFKLNQKARFANGDPVLARDVAESFRLLTQDKAAAPLFRVYWSDVARVETPDARTVRFVFKKRNAELHMTLGELPIFSHKSYPKGLAAAANALPIGSGPYLLSKTVSNRQSEYSRRKDYWAQKLPVRRGMFNFDTVRLKYYQDDTVRVERVKGGQYDFMQENTAALWARGYPDSALKRHGLVKKEWQQQSTAGMQGFVMNMRRTPLNDIRVRQALVLSFDFESVNRRMFYGVYTRSNSFFTNSEMAATGKPTDAELAILLPLKNQLSAAVFSQNVPQPPKVDPKLGVRPNLLQARSLFEQAGFRYQNGVLVDKKGKPLVLEFVTYNKNFGRVVSKWQRDLAKIGVTLKVRVTDSAVFRKRLDDFNFDLTITNYSNSESPGNEQFDYYSCATAKTPGSRNYAGMCDPAIEVLLKRFESFNNRADLVASARALDRVLRHQYIIVPNWYSDTYRVIYRENLGVPSRPPKYYSAMDWALKTWWVQK